MSAFVKTLRCGALGSGLALVATAASAQAVKVHSDWPQDRLAPLAEAAEKAAPGVKIDWTDADQAEFLWGVPVRLLMAAEREGRLEGYTPAGAPRLRASFHSASSPMGWTGLTATAPAVCFNTLIGGQSFAMPTPATWETLASSAFNLAYGIGPQVQMVDLAEAPTGAGLATGWAAAMGETAAARFVRALSTNVVEARREAAAVCRAVAEGFSAVGVGVTPDALALAAQGANLQIIVPTPVAYEMDGSALGKGASEAAKKLADFAVSRDAMALYAKGALIVSLPGVANTIDPVPPASSRDLETIDFSAEKAAAADVLRAWKATGKSAR